MTELEAINIALAAIGEAGVQTLDDPSQYAADARAAIARARRRILMQQSTAQAIDRRTLSVETITISGQSESRVRVPVDAIALAFPNHLDNLTIRNGYVYDRNTSSYYASSVEAEVTVDLAIGQLPASVAYWIAREAALELVEQMDGASAEWQIQRQRATDARQEALNDEPADLTCSSGFGRVIAAHSGGASFGSYGGGYYA